MEPTIERACIIIIKDTVVFVKKSSIFFSRNVIFVVLTNALL